MAKIKVIRLKSDNFDCYVSPAAYREICLQMSSGDFGVHRHRTVQVSPERFEEIKFHREPGFVDLDESGKHFGEPVWFFYDGKGDCYVEPLTPECCDSCGRY